MTHTQPPAVLDLSSLEATYRNAPYGYAIITRSVIAGQPRDVSRVVIVATDGDTLTYTTDGVWYSTVSRAQRASWRVAPPESALLSASPLPAARARSLNRALAPFGDIYASYHPAAAEGPAARITVMGTFSTLPHWKTAEHDALQVALTLGFTATRNRVRAFVNGCQVWRFTLSPDDVPAGIPVDSDGYPYALTFSRGKPWEILA